MVFENIVMLNWAPLDGLSDAKNIECLKKSVHKLFLLARKLYYLLATVRSKSGSPTKFAIELSRKFYLTLATVRSKSGSPTWFHFDSLVTLNFIPCCRPCGVNPGQQHSSQQNFLYTIRTSVAKKWSYKWSTEWEDICCERKTLLRNKKIIQNETPNG